MRFSRKLKKLCKSWSEMIFSTWFNVQPRAHNWPERKDFFSIVHRELISWQTTIKQLLVIPSHDALFVWCVFTLVRLFPQFCYAKKWICRESWLICFFSCKITLIMSKLMFLVLRNFRSKSHLSWERICFVSAFAFKSRTIIKQKLS